MKKTEKVGVVNLRKTLFLPYKYSFFKKCDFEPIKDIHTAIFRQTFFKLVALGETKLI